MKTPCSVSAALVASCLAVAGAAHGQSLNVDFGLAADAPSSTYAAAGLPGTWNSIPGVTGTTYPLVGLDGRPTGVTISQIGGTELRSFTDPSVTGDAARLMNDALLTFDPGLEVCLFINGLAPGTYEVLMYAWMPTAPAVQSRVRHDLSTTTFNVGGAWPGGQVEGVTYARHTLVIGSAAFMGSHSGIVPGAVAANGAALGGFQLRLLGSSSDAGVDAGVDTGVDAGVDARADAAMDVVLPGHDAASDTATDGDRADASTRDAVADTSTTVPHDAATPDAGGHDAARGCACTVGGTRQSRGAGSAAGSVLAAVAMAFRTGRRRRARSLRAA